MMRGADHWAVAVRKPSGDIHVESHDIDSVAKRHPFFAKPFLRGIIVLGQSLAIGTRALLIATNQSMDDDEQLTSRQVGLALALAMIFFVAIFVLGPTVLFHWIQDEVGGGILTNVLEGLFRVALFVGVPVVDRQDQGHPPGVRVPRSRAQDDRGVRARRPARPRARRPYSTVHVRCGTNFLIIVMVITIFVFTLFGTPGFWWRIGSRIIAIPLIAGVAYEALRLGARYQSSLVMRALMAPGLWLQKITTQKPDRGQIQVAIASFDEVLRREAEAAGTSG